MSNTAIITWGKPLISWPARRMRSPVRDDVLTHFAAEVGGTLLEEQELLPLGNSLQVSVYVKPWTIIFENHDISAPGGWGKAYTRVRAPYISPDALDFEIYCPGYFSKLVATEAESFGTGHPDFDRTFAIQPHGDPKAQAVIENPKIRQSLQSLLMKGNDPVLKTESVLGWCHGYQALCYEEGAVITDIARLKSILELFKEVLNQLCRIGSASKDDPNCML